MSRQQHSNARLRGYDAPIFLDLGEALADACEAIGPGARGILIDICRRIPGYQPGSDSAFNTEDGYIWPLKLCFHRGTLVTETNVIIAIPGFHDESKADGTSADRAVAIYTSGDGAKRADFILGQILSGARECLRQCDQSPTPPSR